MVVASPPAIVVAPRDVLASPDRPLRSGKGVSLVGMNRGDRPQISEELASELATTAVDLAGGARMIYRNPRQAFSSRAMKRFEVDGYQVEIRWGEISSPAIASVGGYVFEIGDGEIDLLIRPPRPRTAEND